MTEVEKTTTSFPRLIIIGLSAALVCVGGFAAFLLYDMKNPEEPLILRADGTPFKVKPDDPGGKSLDNQDSAMMSQLDGERAENAETEILTPPVEDPEKPPGKLDPSDEEPAPEISVGKKNNSEEAAEVPEESAPAETAAAPEPEPAPEAEVESVPEPAESIDSAVNQVVSSGGNSSGGNVFVQFGSFREENNARNAAARLTETVASLNAEHKAQLKGRGISHKKKVSIGLLSPSFCLGLKQTPCAVFLFQSGISVLLRSRNQTDDT
jgi:hypothetical protein